MAPSRSSAPAPVVAGAAIDAATGCAAGWFDAVTGAAAAERLEDVDGEPCDEGGDAGLGAVPRLWLSPPEDVTVVLPTDVCATGVPCDGDGGQSALDGL
jgi:hypothetical protein